MAVTYVYADLGIYHRLYITGTGDITDDSIYQYMLGKEITDAVAPGTYMTRTGSSGSYVYTFKLQAGEDYSQLLIATTGTWIRELRPPAVDRYYQKDEGGLYEDV